MDTVDTAAGTSSFPLLCTSRITRVVVHARGALVERRVDVPALPEGDVDLLVPGLTLLAESGSVRAQLPEGSGRPQS